LTSVTVRPVTPISDKRFTHLVELERLDDRFNFFHASAPGKMGKEILSEIAHPTSDQYGSR
jgi:hypothetical protein